MRFQDLYATYSSDVYRFAYWLAGNAADAEDITSETFVRAWVRFDTLKTETLKAYLLAIARNLYLEQLRKGRFQTMLVETHPDAQPGPEQMTEARSDLELAQRVLQALPETDRAAFVMRVEQDLPYAEIARVLKITETAVKVKVHRARKKLLEARLEKELP
jgi:RNA polymerase sigma-70 factor (ECF subfamily)